MIALAAAVAASVAGSSCYAAAATGDRLRFDLVGVEDHDGAIAVVPLDSTAWPRGTLRIARSPDRLETSFLLPGGGYILNLAPQQAGDEWRTLSLNRADGRRRGLAVAYGFCMPSSASAAVKASEPVQEDKDPFPVARWREDCVLLTAAGSVANFRIDRAGPSSGLTFDPEQSGLWPARISYTSAQVSAFGAAGDTAKPYGALRLFVDENEGLAVQLIRFAHLGGTTPQAADPAFAICPIGRLIKNPVRK